MTIQTSITANRKVLATKISEELLHAPVRYAGPPSFAYHVGTTVTIDREGSIEVTDENTLAILKPFFIEEGWMMAETEAPAGRTDEPEPDTTDESEVTDRITDEPEADLEAAPAQIPCPAPDDSISACQISIPAVMTASQLANLVHMLYSEQRLLNHAVLDGRLCIPDSLITRLKEHTPETPEAFSELLNDFKALGELTGFGYENNTVSMDFPHDDAHPERWTTYAGLVERIISTVKAATRVKAELQTSENEKYYMRAWLMRLGYGGADLKAERRLLLHKLKGHSAFPNDDAAEKHREKYAAIRRAGQEASTHAE